MLLLNKITITMKKLIFAICLFYISALPAQKFEGLAMTPPMGWNSWNKFQTNISEKLIMETADQMVSSGMKSAGYTYLVLDDGWMAMERDPKTGNLYADPKKFPHGMKVVADYVHSKGLKFGLYNCAGTKTCAGYPGTRGYEYQDARFYASQDVDYLKFDWCSSEGINAKEAYTTMSKALKTAGRPIIFSLCEWGQNQPWQWAAPVGQLWRTTGDIGAQFAGMKNYGNWSANGVLKIIDLEDTLRKYAGPGHWNDPDMLEVGNGLTESENRAHFSMWCMLAAPLMAGNDITTMSLDTKKIITDKGAISIDQDALGIQAFKYNSKDSIETWCKPLQNGDWAICFLNRKDSPQQVTFDWNKENIKDDIFNKTLDPANMIITDIWANKSIGDTRKTFKGSVGAHDALLFRLHKK